MKTLKDLMKKADTIFSEYVRYRDASEFGMVKCCTCGKEYHWNELDCGHYLSRRKLIVRFSEFNTGPQCKICNNDQSTAGEQLKFLYYLESKYGVKTIDLMDEVSNQTVINSRVFIEENIELYKTKLKQLKS